LQRQPFLEGRAAQRLIEDAQERAGRLHAGQRQQLFKLDEVVEAQRGAFLRAYDAALLHPAPDELLRGLIPAVATVECVASPGNPSDRTVWLAGLSARFGLPRDAAPDPQQRDGAAGIAQALRAALDDRFRRAAAEWGARWPEVARSVLLRTATEQWAAHVDALGEVQQQAPALFSFLTSPVEISYAREANRRYAGFNQLVQAEALANLLTLPLPYERPLAPERAPLLSDAARTLPALVATHPMLSSGRV
jgi:preprotein translocase subunit SecA